MTVIETLEQELTRKRDEVTKLEAALAVLQGVTLTPPKSREFEHLGIIEAAKLLLLEIGPADNRTITDTLLDRGIRTRSKNFAATVCSTLHNSPDFKKADGSNKWQRTDITFEILATT